ncbi:oxalurate catabolism protein HpxZ [Aquabacterium sp.]|uniref:oxalurate catabolism protein HpxZ n=1 Tax=Aquabacterium sp. TaxID=1872578 RepID=UPI002E32B971|nr:oxalurate catabolism protein HpxZ [Aquabacterium sp.]HEX5311480.1 oxalurate catabolism protein HpxZ [Aquabacterium sp.]
MSLTPADIDNPVVHREVRACFDRYEQALMANDVQALNDFFWQDPRVTRYGIADRQHGHDELVAYRQSVPAPQFTRQLHAIRISTWARDMAVVMCEFTRSDTELRGFQTQTWARLPNGWKIVSAHVSMIPWPTP